MGRLEGAGDDVKTLANRLSHGGFNLLQNVGGNNPANPTAINDKNLPYVNLFRNSSLSQPIVPGHRDYPVQRMLSNGGNGLWCFLLPDRRHEP